MAKITNPGGENLIPMTERTEEEQRAIARMGGIASGEARRRKSNMKETLEIMLDMLVGSGEVAEIDEITEIAGMRGKKLTAEQAMLLAQMQRALKGDLAALQFIRDTSGQKPTDKVDASINVPVVFSGEDELQE